MELLSSINNSGIGAQYAVSAAKDVNGNEITSTYLTAVPEGYATESFVTSQGYITGNYLSADTLDNVSSTWNTVTNKLDSTAFSTVSGNFLTAHQSLPSSANWNATYDTVHDNSASWTGGGASVTSPRGTINVNGDEIEGTNSAVLTGTAGGYTTYLQAYNNAIQPTPSVLTYESLPNNAQTGGTLVIPVQGGDTSLYITITGETFGGSTASASGQGSPYLNTIDIPLGEMCGPFTAQATYWVNLGSNVLTASAAPTTGVTGVGELAWNSALDSVRNTSAAWNSTYSTVAINSASWGAGTEYSAGSGIDITDDVISLTNPLTLVPSGDVTIDVTGNSAVISVNAGTSYTGDAQGALDEVYTNSGDWNTVTDKLDTTAFSTVSGDFLTAHQALPNSGNWDETYTTVNNNSASWTNVVTSTATGVSYTTGISAINGTPLLATGVFNKGKMLVGSSDPGMYLTGTHGTAYYKANELIINRTGYGEQIKFNLGSAGSQVIGSASGTRGAFIDMTNASHEAFLGIRNNEDAKLELDGEVITPTKIVNYDSVYATVNTYSGGWTGGGAATLPVSGSAGDNSAVYDLYDMKIECNSPSIGGSEPEHTYTQVSTGSITLYESYDEDQSYNQVYINPGYIEFYNNVDGYVDFGGTDVLNWNNTRETVSNNSASWGAGSTYTGDAQGALDEVYTNSGNWGTASLGISAGPGIAIQIINGTLVISTASV